jgi:hypothetical protein
VTKKLEAKFEPTSHVLKRCPALRRLPYALTFLAVVREEGKPIGVCAREMDLQRFIMGRYFQCFGERGRHGTPGLGLVTVVAQVAA